MTDTVHKSLNCNHGAHLILLWREGVRVLYQVNSLCYLWPSMIISKKKIVNSKSDNFTDLCKIIGTCRVWREGRGVGRVGYGVREGRVWGEGGSGMG